MLVLEKYIFQVSVGKAFDIFLHYILYPFILNEVTIFEDTGVRVLFEDRNVIVA
jgi:hypothetical protein